MVKSVSMRPWWASTGHRKSKADLWKWCNWTPQALKLNNGHHRKRLEASLQYIQRSTQGTSSPEICWNWNPLMALIRCLFQFLTVPKDVPPGSGKIRQILAPSDLAFVHHHNFLSKAVQWVQIQCIVRQWRYHKALWSHPRTSNLGMSKGSTKLVARNLHGFAHWSFTSFDTSTASCCSNWIDKPLQPCLFVLSLSLSEGHSCCKKSPRKSSECFTKIQKHSWNNLKISQDLPFFLISPNTLNTLLSLPALPRTALSCELSTANCAPRPDRTLGRRVWWKRFESKSVNWNISGTW